jgi:transcriptional regulator with XRE-family HTH domain
MDIRDVLALNLRKQRKAKGLSQEELAHRADIDRTYISSLERSLYAAGIDVVDRLARALGTEAADLLRRPAASVDGEKRSKVLAARKARKRV